MILKTVFSILVLLSLTMIQSTWLGPIILWGTTPDLGLLAVVWLSYKNGPVIGTSGAFVSGLIDDALSTSPIGFNAFIKTVVAWVSSFLHGSVALDHVLMPLFLGATATLLKAISSLLLVIIFRNGLETYDFLSRRLWIEVGYNALVAPLIFAALGLLARIVEGRRAQNP